MTETNQTTTAEPRRHQVRWEHILRSGLRQHGAIEPVAYVASVVDHELIKEDRHSVRRAARELVAAGVATRDGERIALVEHEPEPVDSTPRWLKEPAEATKTTVPCPQCKGTGQTLRGHVCAGCGGAAVVPTLPTWQRQFRYDKSDRPKKDESGDLVVEILNGPEQWKLDADADRSSSYPGMDTAPRAESGQTKADRFTMPPGQMAGIPVGNEAELDEVIERVDGDEEKLRAAAHELGKQQGLTPEQVDEIIDPYGSWECVTEES